MHSAGTIFAAAGTGSFDAKALYMSCTQAVGPGVIGEAIAATLAVAAEDIDGNTLSAVTQKYNPLVGLEASAMVRVELPPTWVRLRKFTLGIVVDPLLELLDTSVQVTGLEHCNHPS